MNPFAIPTQPIVLAIAHLATQYEIALSKTLHDEHMHIFTNYQLVQRALIEKFLGAIERKFVIYFRNRVTEQILMDIHI